YLIETRSQTTTTLPHGRPPLGRSVHVGIPHSFGGPGAGDQGSHRPHMSYGFQIALERPFTCLAIDFKPFDRKSGRRDGYAHRSRQNGARRGNPANVIKTRGRPFVNRKTNENVFEIGPPPRKRTQLPANGPPPPPCLPSHSPGLAQGPPRSTVHSQGSRAIS